MQEISQCFQSASMIVLLCITTLGTKCARLAQVYTRLRKPEGTHARDDAFLTESFKAACCSCVSWILLKESSSVAPVVRIGIGRKKRKKALISSAFPNSPAISILCIPKVIRRIRPSDLCELLVGRLPQFPGRNRSDNRSPRKFSGSASRLPLSSGIPNGASQVHNQSH